MSKRISERTRIEAIRLLSVCACQSSPGSNDHVFIVDASDNHNAQQLAGSALAPFQVGKLSDEDWRAAYAEAEARLRMGWVP